jgi:hypothetical protein
MRIKPVLYSLVEKYMKDVDKDEKDGLTPDVVKIWKNQVYEVVKEALEFLDRLGGENPSSEPEDSLPPPQEGRGDCNASCGGRDQGGSGS